MQIRSAKPTETRQLLAPRRKAAVLPIESRITILRQQKIILDTALAEIYGVSVKRLNQQVKRNRSRFPADFMFQLTAEEAAGLRLQTETSKPQRGGRRYLPYVFSEPGVAMLSSVLRSARAVQMNILIMRAFIRLRELIASNKDIATRVEKLERSHDRTASVIEVLVEDIDRLGRKVERFKEPSPYSRRRIGYITEDDE